MDLPGFTDQWQTERQQLFKSVPPEGQKVRYGVGRHLRPRGRIYQMTLA
jgi:hypothetical protein